MIQLQVLACYYWNFPSPPTRRPWGAAGGGWCTWRGRAAPRRAVWRAGCPGSESRAGRAPRPSRAAWTAARWRAARPAVVASTSWRAGWARACSARARLSGVRTGTSGRTESSQPRAVNSACWQWGPPAPSASRATGLPRSGRTCPAMVWSRWRRTCWASSTPCN